MKYISRQLLVLIISAMLLVMHSLQAAADNLKSNRQQPTTTNMSWLGSSLVELGIFGGYTTTINRKGSITQSFFGIPGFPGFTVTNNQSKGAGEVGLQGMLVYDLRQAQPFIYLNASSTLSSINNIKIPFVLVGVGPDGVVRTIVHNSTLVVHNNWLGRLGIGVQTEPLWGSLQLGAGIGASVINQSLKAYIDTFVRNNFSNQRTSFQPTAMALISWRLCQTCFGGYPMLVGGQVTVDRYPQVSSNGTLLPALNYSSTVNQQWIPHADLVLSVAI